MGDGEGDGSMGEILSGTRVWKAKKILLDIDGRKKRAWACGGEVSGGLLGSGLGGAGMGVVGRVMGIHTGSGGGGGWGMWSLCVKNVNDWVLEGWLGSQGRIWRVGSLWRGRGVAEEAGERSRGSSQGSWWACLGVGGALARGKRKNVTWILT